MNYNLIIKEFDSNISGYVEQLKERIKDITFDSGKSVQFTISADLDSCCAKYPPAARSVLTSSHTEAHILISRFYSGYETRIDMVSKIKKWENMSINPLYTLLREVSSLRAGE